MQIRLQVWEKSSTFVRFLRKAQKQKTHNEQGLSNKA